MRTEPKRDRTRYQVSVRRETYRAIQAAAIARGVSPTSVVGQACETVGMEWCDVVAEKAGV